MMNLAQFARAERGVNRFANGGSSGGGGGGGGAAPLLLRTHTTSGSMVGGVNNNGHWLKLFGQGFGDPTAIGTVFGAMVSMRDTHAGGDGAWHTVAAHNYLEQSLNASTESTLCVQVGQLDGGCANGNAVDIKVTVNGVDSNTLLNWYTLQPGDVWFVSPSTGSESTFVVNDIAHPAKHVQFWTGSAFTGLCAPGGPQPGDCICFIDDGTQSGEQHGYYNGSAFGTIFRFAFPSPGVWAAAVGGGTPPTGVKGHGFVHFFFGLPGAGSHTNPHFVFSVGGGIHGCEGGRASSGPTGNGKYVSVTGGSANTLTGAQGDAGFVNCQTGSYFWQISDMEFTGWALDASTLTNCSGFGGDIHGISGNPIPAFCLFTASHDVNGNQSSRQNHCYYWGGSNGGSYDGSTSYFEFGWNKADNALCGSLFQFFWAGSSAIMQGLSVHHNRGKTAVKYGLNLGESVISATVWNNVLIDAGDAALRFCSPNSAIGGVPPAVHVEYCTFFGWNNQGSIADCAILQEGFADAGSLTVRHCIFAGNDARSTTNSWYSNNGAGDAKLTFDQNVYFDYKGTLSGSPARDAHPITTSPLFINRAVGNLSTAANGSGVNASTTAEAFAVTNDFLSVARPIGAHSDIGAYEVA